MNVGLHHRAQRRVDHPVPLDRSLAGKPARKNAHLKMPAAVARPGVPGVPVAIVYHVELVGIERCLQPASNQRDALGGVGAPSRQSDDGAGTWLPASPCPRRVIAGH